MRVKLNRMSKIWPQLHLYISLNFAPDDLKNRMNSSFCKFLLLNTQSYEQNLAPTASVHICISLDPIFLVIHAVYLILLSNILQLCSKCVVALDSGAVTDVAPIAVVKNHVAVSCFTAGVAAAVCDFAAVRLHYRCCCCGCWQCGCRVLMHVCCWHVLLMYRPWFLDSLLAENVSLKNALLFRGKVKYALKASLFFTLGAATYTCINAHLWSCLETLCL